MRMSLRARAGARLKAVSNWASVAPLARRQVGHDLCVEAHRADLVHRAADHSGRSPELCFTGTEPLRFSRAEPRPWRHSCLDRRGVRMPRTNPDTAQRTSRAGDLIAEHTSRVPLRDIIDAPACHRRGVPVSTRSCAWAAATTLLTYPPPALENWCAASAPHNQRARSATGSTRAGAPTQKSPTLADA